MSKFAGAKWFSKLVNLKLNRDKCELAVKSLTFIGDVVSEKGVNPDPRKTSANGNMKRPQNKDEVRRFLGMVTYLAKIIPKQSAISAPLRMLREQKNEWMRLQQQEECFQMLKKILISEPVLRFYDPKERQESQLMLLSPSTVARRNMSTGGLCIKSPHERQGQLRANREGIVGHHICM